jgi:hypothetical protein
MTDGGVDILLRSGSDLDGDLASVLGIEERQHFAFALHELGRRLKTRDSWQ